MDYPDDVTGRQSKGTYRTGLHTAFSRPVRRNTVRRADQNVHTSIALCFGADGIQITFGISTLWETVALNHGTTIRNARVIPGAMSGGRRQVSVKRVLGRVASSAKAVS